MQRFTMKVPGLIQVFDLDENAKTISVTCSKRRKIISQETLEIGELIPEYGEFAPATPRIFPLILAWVVVIIGSLLFGSVTYFMLTSEQKEFTRGALTLLLALLAGPIPGFRQSLFYIFRDRKKEQQGFFYFEHKEQNTVVLNIHYLLKFRKDALKLADKIANLSRSTQRGITIQESCLAKFQFKDTLAELYRSEIKFRNSNNIKIDSFAFEKIQPEIVHIQNKYKWRNIISSILAWLFWLPSLGLIAFIAATEGLIETGAIIVITLLPGVIGLYFWKLRRPEQDVYLLRWEYIPGEIEEIPLSVPKGESAGAERFINDLKKLLNLVHNQ